MFEQKADCILNITSLDLPKTDNMIEVLNKAGYSVSVESTVAVGLTGIVSDESKFQTPSFR